MKPTFILIRNCPLLFGLSLCWLTQGTTLQRPSFTDRDLREGSTMCGNEFLIELLIQILDVRFFWGLVKINYGLHCLPFLYNAGFSQMFHWTPDPQGASQEKSQKRLHGQILWKVIHPRPKHLLSFKIHIRPLSFKKNQVNLVNLDSFWTIAHGASLWIILINNHNLYVWRQILNL